MASSAVALILGAAVGWVARSAWLVRHPREVLHRTVLRSWDPGLDNACAVRRHESPTLIDWATDPRFDPSIPEPPTETGR